VVINRLGVVLDGNHRARAAAEADIEVDYTIDDSQPAREYVGHGSLLDAPVWPAPSGGSPLLRR
jgi:hypothetical protein